MAKYNLSTTRDHMVRNSDRSAGIKETLSAWVSNVGISRLSVSPACQGNWAFGEFSGPEGRQCKEVIGEWRQQVPPHVD